MLSALHVSHLILNPDEHTTLADICINKISSACAPTRVVAAIIIDLIVAARKCSYYSLPERDDDLVRLHDQPGVSAIRSVGLEREDPNMRFGRFLPLRIRGAHAYGIAASLLQPSLLTFLNPTSILLSSYFIALYIIPRSIGTHQSSDAI